MPHDEAPYLVPGDDAFDGKEFMEAEDLDALGMALRQHPEMVHLLDVRITCLWKAKGGVSKGKQTLGKVQAVTGLLGHFTEVDFVVWLAADHLRERGAKKRTVEACLHEELCRLQLDDDGQKVVILAPDFSGFAANLSRYGMWRKDLEQAAEAFRQLSLL